MRAEFLSKLWFRWPIIGSPTTAITASDSSRGATEVLVVGTTINVVAVRAYEGQTIGDGHPGPVYKKLAAMLDADILENSALRTKVF